MAERPDVRANVGRMRWLKNVYQYPKIELKPARPRAGRGEVVGLVRC